MKWFQHGSTDRNEIESKLIRSKFGAEGYGIYCSLQEVIAEYVAKENIPEWGFAHPLHTVETLAQECSTTTEKLQEFLTFCDEKQIFEKRDGRLFCALILKRLDTFAERTRREFEAGSKLVRTHLAHTIQNNTKQKKTKQDTYSSIASLTDEVCESVASQYSVTPKVVINLREELKLYCQSKGKTYKDYRAALMNWLRRRMDEGKVTKLKNVATPPTPEDVPLTEEQRQENITRIADIKAKFPVRSV